MPISPRGAAGAVSTTCAPIALDASPAARPCSARPAAVDDEEGGAAQNREDDPRP
jgi:hypothetical protein